MENDLAGAVPGGPSDQSEGCRGRSGLPWLVGAGRTPFPVRPGVPALYRNSNLQDFLRMLRRAHFEIGFAGLS